MFEDASSSASPEAFLDEQEVETRTTERLQVGDVPKAEQGVQGNLFDGDAKRVYGSRAIVLDSEGYRIALHSK